MELIIPNITIGIYIMIGNLDGDSHNPLRSQVLAIYVRTEGLDKTKAGDIKDLYIQIKFINNKKSQTAFKSNASSKGML